MKKNYLLTTVIFAMSVFGRAATAAVTLSENFGALNRTFILLAAVCLTGGNLFAADASFVGKWKINMAKSDITGFQAKIEDAGNHEFKVIFGDDVETYILDGKEHPTRYGSMRTTTEVDPNYWKGVIKREDKVTGAFEWRVSTDGKELNITYDGTKADGSAFKDETKYKRVAGTSGVVGTWEATKIDPSSFPDWLIEPFEGDGLTLVIPTDKERRSLKFDGKDYPDEGPRVAPGATTASKRLDERTIEVTDKLKGKLIDTHRLELSVDGKTLTATITYPGEEKKEVDVYERQ